MKDPEQNLLYRPCFEHDACGIGAIVSIEGKKTHKTVDDALKIVEKLDHRAGKDASGETGDGVGIMIQISHNFFSAAAAELGLNLGEARTYGVGMFFFPQDILQRNRHKKLLEIILEKARIPFLGWRDVPVKPEVLGQRARDVMPVICQCFVKKPKDVAPGIDFDRKLYIVRREFEQSIVDDTYVVSFSSRTIVYKGMFLVDQLRKFYPDLQDERMDSAIALVHSRFSTNTNPSWKRAHPNRIIMHNGEINTIRGNIDRMLAREETMESPLLAEDIEKVLPVITPDGSDSAMLDNTLEFLMFSGIDLPKAVMITIPEPWNQNQDMPRALRDMYHYYATMMEPWDGPAAVLFSDGDLVGATLDRNGLRPSRYYQTVDGYLVLASEVGVLDVEPDQIVKKSRLRPGQMLVVNTVEKTLSEDVAIKNTYAYAHPYSEWLDQELVTLSSLTIPNKKIPVHTQEQRDKLYKAFGYTYEEIKNAILPMATGGMEPTAAMGVDIPLAVLSEQHQPLFNYFKQMFAQVTNPPLDAIRERIVTDTTVYVGSDGNLLEDKAENCRVLQINNPVLTGTDLLKIKALNMPGLKSGTVSLLYYKNTPLERALEKLFVDCDKEYMKGHNVIILSDRGVDENHTAIPSLLAVSALEQYLVRTKKRTAVSVVLESAEPRDVHHFATLMGYGARAIHPYLAHECIGEMIDLGMLDKDYYTAVDAYNKAILNGVVKIASKMGISSVQSYQSAQIFEAVGINQEVIDKYFTNTISRIGGIGLKEIEDNVVWLHDRAFDPMGLPTDPTVDSIGNHKMRTGLNSEQHLIRPEVILTLQEAVRKGDYAKFKEYSKMIDVETHPRTLRGLTEIAFDRGQPIPISEVEPAESIVKHFKVEAMSYGAISREVHECMATAMNTLGCKSNTGEGGEDASRFGTITNSAIKQVASGRFGVTSEYLVSAKEIQIKMAQGAKPGEGGNLPGKKVWPWIAKTRYSTPGVTLISPPPHHDIYSIEDLAQLIYDLKNANRHAEIAVKLASEAGVGTIAAGVAKGGASNILICGYDGGTGAAPRNSIHNAALPWEMGLSETHQTLMLNDLRSHVVLGVDGKLFTGRDVAIACMLGAEEFGFGTVALISVGCMMMRVCNLDTCPMGIATQNPELRKNFKGKPEYVINFMMFIATELREILAKLGLHSVNELVGRTEYLRMREQQYTRRAETVDLSSLLQKVAETPVHFMPEDVFDFKLDETSAATLLAMLNRGEHEISLNISSTDRAFASDLGAELTRRYGNTLQEDSYRIKCRGGAGQSFGAFIPKGLTLELEGDSNDYFGKGLSGGKLIVYPDRSSRLDAAENVIIGNVALYGATGGKAFVSGIAGERFCVRNSGATVVVEGVGDHGCEYMTGGKVAVLGRTGRNFAAGMSGGIAYVLDTEHDFYRRVNKELVTVEQLHESADIMELKKMITEHVKLTGSKRGREILEDFDNRVQEFKKVISRDYSQMIERIAEYRARGFSQEQAEIEAFTNGGK